ncbi:CoA transferase [Rhodococcus koreensis]|uniref:CoA transferase n=1 Tax=Rhodococcus koreensis TaxID=99653 RepID=UPI00366FB1E1
MTTGALSGLRVLDLGQYLAGPMLAMFLGDNGADVIHIDPPDGPRWDSPANAALYRNKRQLRLDLHDPAAVARAAALAESADVVVDNFRPGVLERLGLDPAAIRERTPRLVWCSLPGFPRDDPRADLPGWDGLLAAATGLYPPRHGEIDGDPVFSALPMASTFAAFMASHRVAGALLTRASTGRGAWIEVSLYEAAFQAVGSYAEVPVSRKTDNPTYARLHRMLQTARAADGTHLYFDTPLRGLQRFLDRFLPQYRLVDLDDSTCEQMVRDLVELIGTRSGRDWERICQEELQGAFGLCQSTREWLADDHARASRSVIEVADPVLGATVQPGFPVLLSESRPQLRWGRSARPDGVGPEADVDWAGEGFSWSSERRLRHDLALDGVRVLDCASLLAGPTSTRVLAQYGADVLKVDSPAVAASRADPLTDDLSAFHGHRTVSSGKRMAFLDLRDERIQGLLPDLIGDMDVVHHNFTPAAAERLGLGAERVRELNPAAIYSTMSLHSHGGSRAEYRGHEPLAQMVTGMGVRAGGEGPPRMLGVVVNDHAAGHLNAFGIMLALLDRLRTGAGQQVNASLSRTATLHQLPFAIGYDGRSWDEPSGPEATGRHALDRLYRARDGWFYLAAGSDGRDLLAQVAGLAESVAVPDGHLGAWLVPHFAARGVAEAVAELRTAGIGAHRYVPVIDLVEDPTALRRGLLAVVDHPGIGRAFGIGHPVFGTFEDSARPFLAARRPGLDTVDVVEELGAGRLLDDLIGSGAVAGRENPVVNVTDTPGYWASGSIESYTTPARLARTIEVIGSGQPRRIHRAP